MRRVFIIDRSDLDEVVAVRPGKDGSPAQHITRREDLTSAFLPRRDIVLENVDVDCTCESCGTPHKRNRQLWIEVTETGFTGNLELFEKMSPAQREQVEKIAQRMRQNARDYPPAAKLLAKIYPEMTAKLAKLVRK